MSGRQTPLESNLHRRAVKFINELPNAYAFKTHGGPYGAGQPDILGCVNGRAIAIECKREGGKTTALQDRVLALWSKAGAVVGVAYSMDDIKAILEVE